MESCKYENRAASFGSIKESMDDGRSQIGYWISDRYGVCEKFEKADNQFEKRHGFLFCGCPSKCSFYEKIAKNDEEKTEKKQSQ